MPFHTEQSPDGQLRERVANADMRRTGRPRTVRTDVALAKIVQCVEVDRRWSLQELQAHTGIDQATVHKILREDLHMRKIAKKWVPHALTEQKWCRYETRIHLERYEMKERTCSTTTSQLMKHGSRLMNLS